jgi:hypothetical protein
MFIANMAEASDTVFVSPMLYVSESGMAISFWQRMEVESGFDGAVLEISVMGAPYAEFEALGGTFSEGGYNGVMGPSTVLHGSSAWTGSTGFFKTVAHLPSFVTGNKFRLRWRFVSDPSVAVADQGWWIDSLEILPSTSALLVDSFVCLCPDGFAGERCLEPVQTSGGPVVDWHLSMEQSDTTYMSAVTSGVVADAFASPGMSVSELVESSATARFEFYASAPGLSYQVSWVYDDVTVLGSSLVTNASYTSSMPTTPMSLTLFNWCERQGVTRTIMQWRFENTTSGDVLGVTSVSFLVNCTGADAAASVVPDGSAHVITLPSQQARLVFSPSHAPVSASVSLSAISDSSQSAWFVQQLGASTNLVTPFFRMVPHGETHPVPVCLVVKMSAAFVAAGDVSGLTVYRTDTEMSDTWTRLNVTASGPLAVMSMNFGTGELTVCLRTFSIVAVVDGDASPSGSSEGASTNISVTVGVASGLLFILVALFVGRRRQTSAQAVIVAAAAVPMSRESSSRSTIVMSETTNSVQSLGPLSEGESKREAGDVLEDSHTRNTFLSEDYSVIGDEDTATRSVSLRYKRVPVPLVTSQGRSMAPLGAIVAGIPSDDARTDESSADGASTTLSPMSSTDMAATTSEGSFDSIDGGLRRMSWTEHSIRHSMAVRPPPTGSIVERMREDALRHSASESDEDVYRSTWTSDEN